MICQFCNATMDERKIYGVFVEGDLIVTCSRCYPIKDNDQTDLTNYIKQKKSQKV